MAPPGWGGEGGTVDGTAAGGKTDWGDKGDRLGGQGGRMWGVRLGGQGGEGGLGFRVWGLGFRVFMPSFAGVSPLPPIQPGLGLPYSY